MRAAEAAAGNRGWFVRGGGRAIGPRQAGEDLELIADGKRGGRIEANLVAGANEVLGCSAIVGAQAGSKKTAGADKVGGDEAVTVLTFRNHGMARRIAVGVVQGAEGTGASGEDAG